MTNELIKWASTERQFIKDELMWFNAGAKLTSPSGDDITKKKVAELEQRLEHVNRAIDKPSN